MGSLSIKKFSAAWLRVLLLSVVFGSILISGFFLSIATAQAATGRAEDCIGDLQIKKDAAGSLYCYDSTGKVKYAITAADDVITNTLNKAADKSGLTQAVAPAAASAASLDKDKNAVLGAVLSPVAILMWMIFKIASLLLGLAGLLFNWTMLALVFDFSKYLGNSPGMTTAWGILRDFGNIGLLFGFVFMGIATILDLHSYPWKKALPALVIFAVLLNFSLFAAEAVVDSANVLAVSLYKITDANNACSSESWIDCVVNTGVAGQLLTRLQINSTYDDDSGSTIDSLGAGIKDQFTNPLGNILKFVALALVTTVAAVVLFAGAFMLLSRAVILALLMVTSPVGFAGMAIPGLKKLAEEWWHKLINQALFAPVFLLLLFVSLKMTDGLNQLQKGGLAAALTVNSTETTGTLIVFALIIGFMIGSLMLASKFGIYGADMAIKTAGGAVYGTMGAIGRRTVGKYAYNQAERLKQNRKYVNSGFGRMVIKGFDKAGAGNWDFRSNAVTKAGASATGLNLGKAQHGGMAHIIHEGDAELEKLGRDLKQTPEEKAEVARAAADVKKEAEATATLVAGQKATETNAAADDTKNAATIETMMSKLAEDQAARKTEITDQEYKVKNAKDIIIKGTETAKLDTLKTADAAATKSAMDAIDARQATFDAEKEFYRKTKEDFKEDIEASTTRLKERTEAQKTVAKETNPQLQLVESLRKDLKDSWLLRQTAAPEVYEHAAHKLEKWATSSDFDRGIAKLTETLKAQGGDDAHNTKKIVSAIKAKKPPEEHADEEHH